MESLCDKKHFRLNVLFSWNCVSLDPYYIISVMQKFFKLFFICVFIFSFSSGLIAQDTPLLPKGFSEAEKGLITNFQFRSNSVTPPPTSPVRTAAEWEEVEYLVLRWTSQFENILLQIVAATVEECKILIATQNPGSVQNFLTSNGIDITNVEFLNIGTNSIWIRDYAGNTVYTEDVGELALTDWIYNRPRPLDDVLPSAHAAYLDVPIYITDSGTNDLVNTGGNFMSDGLGNAFASKLVLQENQAGNPYGVTAKTEAQIDNIMEQYMGITNYIKMDQVPFDPISHIDMHMKLLDEETILVSRYPTGVADGPQIEQNIDYVTSTFSSPFGTDYKIEWIDAPPSTGGNYPDNGGHYRTYTNSVFINKTVLVPTYRPEVDVPALQLYEELLPGFTIVGIDVDNAGENLISQSGAIHCITHTIGVADPLWIVHQPLVEVNTSVDIPVLAMIKHISGINTATVFWRESGTTTFQETTMSPVDAENWNANLTVPGSAAEIEYYIWAESNSGKTMTRPIVAPDGYWTFTIGTLSTEDWASQNIVGPYPNPANETVNFNLRNIPGKMEITVHSILGQELYKTSVENANGVISIDLNPSWKGTLFFTFSGEFGRVHKKVLKL